MKPRKESAGECKLCGLHVSRRQMLRHLPACAYPDGGSTAAVAQIRVDVAGSPFWIDLDVKTNAPMRALDEFLRDVWLECCGHLSSFNIGRTRYMTVMSDRFFALGDERSMDARVSASLPEVGTTFSHEYDFGSTTVLRLKVLAQRLARSRRAAVRLLARNDAPVWICSKCEDTAAAICGYCFEDEFVCEAHMEEHKCGDEAMLPVVNSPRMGICGYGG